MTLAVIGTNISYPQGVSPANYRANLTVGLKNKNIKFYETQRSLRTDTTDVCVWGWKMGKIYKSKGFNTLIMERGYIGDRFHYTSLGWNGLNGYADFPEYPDDDGERFYAHGGQIKPWKKSGDYALILGQVPNDASLQGKNLIPWYEEMAKKVTDIYKIPVHFRPHPDCARKGINQVVNGTIKSEGSLQEALDGAKFTIAYNSNSCLDSILSGVPCVAGDRGTMAWDLCSKDIENIIYPDRERHVFKIAWTQWSPDEIKEGSPLEVLCGQS